jgi:hypothetical protein
MQEFDEEFIGDTPDHFAISSSLVILLKSKMLSLSSPHVQEKIFISNGKMTPSTPTVNNAINSQIPIKKRKKLPTELIAIQSKQKKANTTI